MCESPPHTPPYMTSYVMFECSMRASRLLRMLLLLQNRGRRTARQLADELEVAPRTILRDVDAMTEAGLPIVVHQGNRGGIELGFNYRTRLTGLDAEEAEALGVLLATPAPGVEALGLAPAAARAVTKLIESFPDTVRNRIATAQSRFGTRAPPAPAPDPRVAAVAQAIRDRDVVTLRARSRDPQRVRPLRLILTGEGWVMVCKPASGPETEVPLKLWGDINISRAGRGAAP